MMRTMSAASEFVDPLVRGVAVDGDEGHRGLLKGTPLLMNWGFVSRELYQGRGSSGISVGGPLRCRVLMVLMEFGLSRGLEMIPAGFWDGLTWERPRM